MGRTAIKRQIERYEAANAAAALIVLSEPERYVGGLQEWAELVAHRLANSDPDRYPELTQAWARHARKQAFHKRDAQYDQASQEEWDEMSELKSWNRR